MAIQSLNARHCSLITQKWTESPFGYLFQQVTNQKELLSLNPSDNKSAAKLTTPQKLFERWQTQFARIEPAIQTLMHARVLNPSHLPLTLYVIFKTYIRETLELIQMHEGEESARFTPLWEALEEKLLQSRIDKKLMKIELKEELTVFFDQLEHAMEDYNIESSSFSANMKYWISIFSVTHLMDMTLGGTCEKEARECSKDELNRFTRKKRHIIRIPILAQDLQIAALLLVKEFEKSSQKGIALLKSALAYPLSEDSKKVFNHSYFSIDEKRKKLEEFEKLCSEFIHFCKHTDFTPPNEAKTFLDKVTQLYNIFADQFNEFYDEVISELEKILKEVPDHQLIRLSSVKLGTGAKPETPIAPLAIAEVKELVKFLKPFQEATSRLDADIGMNLVGFANIFNGFYQPPSHSRFAPEKLGFERSAYANMSIDALVNEIGGKKRGKKSKKKSNPPPPLQKIQIKQISQPTTPLKKIKETPLEKAPHIPFFLNDQIEKLQNTTPSVFLEQALSHLGKLHVFYSRLESSYREMTPLEVLNSFAAFCDSCHLFLEQSFNFQLTQQETTLPTSHNLLIHHQKLYNNKRYPWIIETLSNASIWTRYFIGEQSHRKDMTTRAPAIPPLVTDLTQLAEGIEVPADLRHRIKMIFETTLNQGSKILFNKSFSTVNFTTSTQISPSNIDLPQINTCLERLRSLQTSASACPDKSALICCKQAIADLEMLQASLKEWNRANNTLEIASWTSWALKQTQECLENALRAIATLKNLELATSHQIEEGLSILQLNIRPDLRPSLANLSWKTRYPLQFKASSSKSTDLAQKLLDITQAFIRHPELLEDFTVKPNSKSPWKEEQREIKPISLEKLSKRMQHFLSEAIALLEKITTL